jgi:hypothetical protein
MGSGGKTVNILSVGLHKRSVAGGYMRQERQSLIMACGLSEEQAYAHEDQPDP